MPTTLALGIFALVVAFVSFVARFVLPAPRQPNGRPQATLLHDGWMPVVTLTLVPALAGLMFLAAWWQQSDALAEPVAQVPVSGWSSTN
ncbi:MAG: hypothetical protein H6732_12505 [Alphaproteobacteria bacterium]|nr:hypothetical protein [Alphaproteobacteria bacterium]